MIFNIINVYIYNIMAIILPRVIISLNSSNSSEDWEEIVQSLLLHDKKEVIVGGLCISFFAGSHTHILNNEELDYYNNQENMDTLLKILRNYFEPGSISVEWYDILPVYSNLHNTLINVVTWNI